MFTGWLSYAGVEIVNEARLFAYTRSLGIPGSQCEDCPTLITAFEHEPYTTPAADNAPWYDADIPESGQVAGFYIRALDGLGDTATRRVDELTRNGAIVGSRRRSSRQLNITVQAVAASDCALSYAMGWLARVLRGADCSPVAQSFGSSGVGCASETLCMLTCCPLTPEDIPKYLTSLHRVGVTQGPNVVSQSHESTFDVGDECGLVICDAEITFTAGDPGWYSPLVNIIDTPLAPFYVGTTDPFNAYDITEPCNPLASNANAVVCSPIVPSGCGTSVVPSPQVLPIPCLGIPDPRTTYTQYNFYSIPIDTSGISQWLDLVPQLIYRPGFLSPTGDFASPQDIANFEGPIAFQLRRVTPGNPCGEESDPCDVCLELFAPLWPRSTEGVADWIERKLFRMEANGTGLCPLPVYTRGLAPFNWPTLVCGSEMCLDIYITTDSDARTGSVRLDVMRRQDAQC